MSARLLKVIVQPVFVVEDDQGLSEQSAQPVTVQARDWEAFRTPEGGFDASLAQVLAQLDVPPPPFAERTCSEVHPESDVYHPEGH